MAGVSASPELASEMAHSQTHVEMIQSLHEAASDLPDHRAFVSRPVDKNGAPIGDAVGAHDMSVDVEAVLERAAERRAKAGAAVSSIDAVERMRADNPVVLNLRAEQANLCARLGELRANYLLQERAIVARIEQVTTRLAVAEEMSK